MVNTQLSPQPPRLWLLALNLFLIVAVVSAVCAWIYRFTSIYPQVVNLLGLGGLFAWVAVLFQLISDETKKKLQSGFEASILARYWTLTVILILAGAFFVLCASRHGSILLDTAHDDRDRVIQILPADKADSRQAVLEDEPLASRAQQKYSLPTPWWGQRRYWIKASGLPSVLVNVQALHRRTIPVPSFFSSRPTLVVHLSAVLTASAQTTPRTLIVIRNGNELGSIYPYLGETVWVGCDEEVDIPEVVLSRWRLDLVKSETSMEVLSRWRPRRSIGSWTLLAEGDVVEMALTSAYGSVHVKPIQVKPPYPLEVDIDVPHS